MGGAGNGLAIGFLLLGYVVPWARAWAELCKCWSAHGLDIGCAGHGLF
jgi:hypothetical protein